MKAAIALLALSLAWPLCASRAEAEAAMAVIPAGSHRPLFRAEKSPAAIPVRAFQMDVAPVTNGEFLAFVREHPQWQRSRVKRLFAEEGYLAHWAGDTDLGSAQAEQPVTRVSWFAAKAYAAARGKRLPTTDEWEYAASAGFTSADGATEPEFQKALALWHSTPSPAELPAANSGRPNYHGIRGLHGLVWEWTSDFNSAMVTGDSRSDGPAERQLFCGSGAAGARDRGDFAAFMRYGLRSSLKASYTVHNLGFRCAKDLP